MADRSIKLTKLRKILRHFGIGENPSKGKGSHSTFIKKNAAGKVTASYPVPTTIPDVLICYIKGSRRRFSLTAADGISDKDFYEAG